MRTRERFKLGLRRYFPRNTLLYATLSTLRGLIKLGLMYGARLWHEGTGTCPGDPRSPRSSRLPSARASAIATFLAWRRDRKCLLPLHDTEVAAPLSGSSRYATLLTCQLTISLDLAVGSHAPTIVALPLPPEELISDRSVKKPLPHTTPPKAGRADLSQPCLPHLPPACLLRAPARMLLHALDLRKVRISPFSCFKTNDDFDHHPFFISQAWSHPRLVTNPPCCVTSPPTPLSVFAFAALRLRCCVTSALPTGWREPSSEETSTCINYRYQGYLSRGNSRLGSLQLLDSP